MINIQKAGDIDCTDTLAESHLKKSSLREYSKKKKKKSRGNYYVYVTDFHASNNQYFFIY